MDKTQIQKLSLGTLSMSQPFDKPFTSEEAEHIKKLLSLDSSKDQVTLLHFSREGFDGETFHYAGLRRKDGIIPKDTRIKRVYTAGFINLGFVSHPRESIEFIKVVERAGIEIDHFLKCLIK